MTERNLRGWIPDVPDHRDLVLAAAMRAAMPPAKADVASLLNVAPDQGALGSCFPAGTPILLADRSERPIEEVAIGNMVVTHSGQVRPVTKTMRREYSGFLYRIKIGGWAYPLASTDEHPFATIDTETGQQHWTKACDLKPGQFVLMTCGREPSTNSPICVSAIIPDDTFTVDGKSRVLYAPASHAINDVVPLTTDLARLIGLFLAEGSYRKTPDGTHCGVNFTFARHEREYQNFCRDSIQRIFGANARIIESDKRPSVADVRSDNTTLAKLFLALCGEGAIRKRISPIFLVAPHEIRMALIKGWLQGDGVQNPIRTKARRNGAPRRAVQVDGVTSSEQLHRDLFRMCLLCNLKPGATTRKQAPHQNVAAKSIVFYSSDVVSLFPESKDDIGKAGLSPTGATWYRRIGSGSFACKIRSIEVEEAKQLPVYNIEVQDEHSYIANCIAVHNCVGNATTSAMEHAFRRQKGQPTDFSRLFVYFHARAMGGFPTSQDTGCYVRDAMKVVSKLGVCLEQTWAYAVGKFAQRPNAAADAEAANNQALWYYRCLDLAAIKACIGVDGAPVVGGFSVPATIYDDETGRTGIVKYPASSVRIIGGHAVIFCGYDDAKRLLKFQNSWGAGWGDGGFGYLPYDFIERGLADDFWTIRQVEIPQPPAPTPPPKPPAPPKPTPPKPIRRVVVRRRVVRRRVVRRRVVRRRK